VLLVEKHFDPGEAKVATIVFDDGTLYDALTIENLARQEKDDFINGSSAADVLDGGAGDDDLRGGAGNDTLLGGSGDDRLDGETGTDVMDGGPGNDFFVVDSTGDSVVELPAGGVDRVAAYVSLVLPSNVEALSLISAAINGTGNSLDNVLTGNSSSNRLEGGAGNDVLDGGGGADTMLGGPGDDTFYVDNSADTVTEDVNAGTDLIVSSVTRTLGANQEHLTLSGINAINGTGNTANNHLKGNGANNTLNGAGGTDVLQGAAGNDALTDSSGRGLFDGGDGADTLTGGSERQFFAGGGGGDTFTLGGGADVIAFNRGQGADAINAPTSGAGLGEKNDTLSLAGILYGELRLAREAGDLLLKVAGSADSIRLKGWYSSSNNQTVNTLQVIVDSTSDYNAASTDSLRNKRLVRLNFGSLVTAFNAAGSPADWSIPQASLAAAYMSSGDTEAIGGQLAYRYGRDGNLAGVDFATAINVLTDANFGTALQPIGSGPTSGGLRLMRAASSSAPMKVALLEADPVVIESDAAHADSVGGIPPPPNLAATGADAAGTGAERWTLDDRVEQIAGLAAADVDDDWVTGRPVQRYVTQADAEGPSSEGGSATGYLTTPDIEKLLAGIDLERRPGRASAAVAEEMIDAAAVQRRWTLADATFRRASESSALPLLGGEAAEAASTYAFASLGLATAEAGGHGTRRVRANVLC